ITVPRMVALSLWANATADQISTTQEKITRFILPSFAPLQSWLPYWRLDQYTPVLYRRTLRDSAQSAQRLIGSAVHSPGRVPSPPAASPSSVSGTSCFSAALVMV